VETAVAFRVAALANDDGRPYDVLIRRAHAAALDVGAAAAGVRTRQDDDLGARRRRIDRLLDRVERLRGTPVLRRIADGRSRAVDFRASRLYRKATGPEPWK
jgi:hypothetical protein